MKIQMTLLMVLFLLCISVEFAGAHPPQTVELFYDVDSQVLTIAGKHKTDDPEKDYLKKMVFSINGEEVQTEYFQRQYSRLKFSKEVTIAAEEDDEISVKIISAEGGSKTVSLIVSADAAEDQEAEGVSKKDLKVEKTAGPTTKGYSSGSSKGSGY